jgi:hypothetical protein
MHFENQTCTESTALTNSKLPGVILRYAASLWDFAFLKPSPAAANRDPSNLSRQTRCDSPLPLQGLPKALWGCLFYQRCCQGRPIQDYVWYAKILRCHRRLGEGEQALLLRKLWQQSLQQAGCYGGHDGNQSRRIGWWEGGFEGCGSGVLCKRPCVIC